MKIGIDLDGVCYGFTEAFCRNVRWDPTKVNKWEFYKDEGWTADMFLTECRYQIGEGLLFQKGDLLPGTKEAFDALIAAGHTIHIVTDRCSLDPEDTALIERFTKDWLLDNALYYESIHFTGDKAKVAKDLGLDFFIDDRTENIEVLDYVTTAYLFDRPWNQPDGLALLRVKSWDEFVGIVANATKSEDALTEWEKDLDLAAEAETEQVRYDDGSWSREVRITSETGGQKGQKLARLGSLDPKALMEVAKVAGFGEQKYARLNYLKGYDWSLSYDACQRHLHAYWSGEDLDPESGLPHLAHAAWHCLAQLAFLIHGIGTDDRYKPGEEAA